MGYRKWGNLCGGDGLRNKGEAYVEKDVVWKMGVICVERDGLWKRRTEREEGWGIENGGVFVERDGKRSWFGF